MSDSSDKKILKWFSIEFIVYLLVTAFMGGIAWNSIASGQQVTADKVTAMEVKNINLEVKVQEVDIKLERIETNQGNLKEVIDKHIAQQRDDAKEQRKEMAGILQAIQQIGK